MLPTTQYEYQKGLGKYDAHLCVFNALQSGYESRQEPRIVKIIFSDDFNRVNHTEILLINAQLCEYFEVLCCLFVHTFSSLGRSTSWSMFVAINYLITWCRERLGSVL